MPAGPRLPPRPVPSRVEPGDMVVVGVVVIVVGSVEAVSVSDGEFTAALELNRLRDRIHLQFPESMREDVRAQLCCRVEVEGCLRDDVGYSQILEVHNLRRLP